MLAHLRVPWLADLFVDTRFGWRMLRRSPGFTCAALLTLAPGIGANTAMFGVADGVLLRPPPFDHPQRLFWIYGINCRLRLTRLPGCRCRPANFLDWRRHCRTFESIPWSSFAANHGSNP